MGIVICALFVARTASAYENGQNDRKSNFHWLRTNLILDIKVSFRTKNLETNVADPDVNSWAFVRRPIGNPVHQPNHELIEIQSLSNEEIENHM